MRSYLGLAAIAVAVVAIVVSLQGTATAQRVALDGVRLLAKVLAPIGDGIDHNTASATVGTTPTEAVTSDLDKPFRDRDDVIQLLVITNKHASNNLCFFDVANTETPDGGLVDAGTYRYYNCANICGNESRTCDGTAATDGAYILPSTQRQFIVGADRCACVVASASATGFSADRVTR